LTDIGFGFSSFEFRILVNSVGLSGFLDMIDI